MPSGWGTSRKKEARISAIPRRGSLQYRAEEQHPGLKRRRQGKSTSYNGPRPQDSPKTPSPSTPNTPASAPARESGTLPEAPRAQGGQNGARTAGGVASSTPPPARTRPGHPAGRQAPTPSVCKRRTRRKQMRGRQCRGFCRRAALTNEWHTAVGDVSVRGAAVHHLLRPGGSVSVARVRRIAERGAWAV